MCDEPQSYLNIQYSWNNPNLECFYMVIQVGSTHINNISGLAATVLTWDSKLTPTQIPYWLHGGAENVKNMTWVQDLPHPR